MTHIHAEAIKAWADGAEIEWLEDGINWIYTPSPYWNVVCKYRIKPTPKPDVVLYGITSMNCGIAYVLLNCPTEATNIKLTFDGETRKLKAAEVVNG